MRHRAERTSAKVGAHSQGLRAEKPRIRYAKQTKGGGIAARMLMVLCSFALVAGLVPVAVLQAFADEGSIKITSEDTELAPPANLGDAKQDGGYVTQINVKEYVETLVDDGDISILDGDGEDLTGGTWSFTLPFTSEGKSQINEADNSAIIFDGQTGVLKLTGPKPTGNYESGFTVKATYAKDGYVSGSIEIKVNYSSVFKSETFNEFSISPASASTSITVKTSGESVELDDFWSSSSLNPTIVYTLTNGAVPSKSWSDYLSRSFAAASSSNEVAATAYLTVEQNSEGSPTVKCNGYFDTTEDNPLSVKATYELKGSADIDSDELDSIILTIPVTIQATPPTITNIVVSKSGEAGKFARFPQNNGSDYYTQGSNIAVKFSVVDAAGTKSPGLADDNPTATLINKASNSDTIKGAVALDNSSYALGTEDSAGEAKYTATFNLTDVSATATYILKLSAQSNVSNVAPASDATNTIVRVDKDYAPVLTADYGTSDPEPATADANLKRAYYGTARSLTLHTAENSPVPLDATSFNSVKYKKNDADLSIETTNTSSNSQYSETLVLDEGIYTTGTFAVKDIFGLVATAQETYTDFVIDTAAPKAKITFDGDTAATKGTELSNPYLPLEPQLYKWFKNHNVALKFTGETETGHYSAIDKIEYLYVAKEELSAQGSILDGSNKVTISDPMACLADSKIIDSESTTFGGTLWNANEFNKLVGSDGRVFNDKFVLFVKVTGKNGKSTTVCTDGYILDGNAPVGSKLVIPASTYTYTQSSAQTVLFNSRSLNTFSLDVNDPAAVGDQWASGLREAKVTVEGGNFSNTPFDLTPGFNDPGRLSQQDINNLKLTAAPFSLSALDDANNMKLYLDAKDNAGNQSHQQMLTFSIDTAPPVVTVSYDNNDVRNDKYFNAARVATITVVDKNVDEEVLKNARVSTNGSYNPAFWHKTPGSGDKTNNENETYVNTITFNSDQDFYLNRDIVFTDRAGNPARQATSASAAPWEFTVDLIDPTLEVSFDNNDVRNEKYFNRARPATITINEHNFREGDGFTLTAARDGGSVSASGFSLGSDVHVATVDGSVEGDYTITVAYTDLAGREARATYTGPAAQAYTVDTTAPVVQFTDAVAPMSANNDVVQPAVTLTDRNYDVNGKEITITGVQRGSGAAQMSYATITDGEQGTVADMPHTPASDDIYTIKAALTDLAGNSADDTLMYSVNRFGSTWFITGATKALVDSYYTKAASTVELHEVNVNDVSKYEVTVARDADIRVLKTADFSIAKTGKSDTWKENTYSIPAAAFADEGLYEVTVTSTDAAGNTSSSRAARNPDGDKSIALDFIVDKTAPTLVVTGIDDGGVYNVEVQTALVSSSDNVALDRVDVYLNDDTTPVASFAAEEFKASEGKVSYNLSASDARQKVTFIAHDMAGNATDDKVVSNLFVNPDPILLFAAQTPLAGLVSNPPLLYGVIALLAAATIALAAALVWQVLKRRRSTGEAGAATAAA